MTINYTAVTYLKGIVSARFSMGQAFQDLDIGNAFLSIQK